MCARYFIIINEKDSISLSILRLGICRSWRCLVVVVWIVPHIHAMIIMGGSIVHPVGFGVGVEWRIYLVFNV